MYQVILQKKWKSLKKQLIKNVKDYHNQNGVKNNDNNGFYIQQIIVILLVLNLKNYCYFKFRDIILLSIDAIMDLIYTIVIYIVYGFGMTILTLYNGIGIETIFYTVIFVFGIVKIFQIVFIFKNKKINKKMMKITWIIEIIIFIIWLIFNQ